MSCSKAYFPWSTVGSGADWNNVELHHGIRTFRVYPNGSISKDPIGCKEPTRGHLNAGRLMPIIFGLSGFNRVPKRVRSAIYKELRNEIPEFGTIQEQRAVFIDVVHKLARWVDMETVESELLKLS